MIKVQYLPRKTNGRYFIISDPHGYYDHVMTLLKIVKFNPIIDRLIIDGDLVDRGPDSMKCLMLLFQPWVTVVRGNHDDNILRVMKSIQDANLWGMSRDSIINGAKIMMEKSPIDFEWFIHWLMLNQDWTVLGQLISKLGDTCHILVVGDGNDRFNVVHGNLLDAGISSDSQIDQVHGVLNQKMQSALLGSRKLAKEALLNGRQDKIVDDKEGGLSITFCGHSIMPCVTSYKNHVFIDTGCYLKSVQWSGLTAIEWPSKRTYFVPSDNASVRTSVAA